MKWIIPTAALAAFLLGSTLAGNGPDRSNVVQELNRHQELLYQDLEKIDMAARDIQEIRATREAGEYVLNREEVKLEKKGHHDMHVFMERCRNDTLQVLQILDRALGKESYVDPLRAIYGKALDELVSVDWREEMLEDIIGQLADGYGVPLYVDGSLDVGKTMSLQGDLTLMAILLQIENVFDAKLALREGEMWFVPLTGSGEDVR